MKRSKKLSLDTENGTLEVSIKFDGINLTREEHDRVVNSLTDKVAKEMTNAPYMGGTYVHQVSVK